MKELQQKVATKKIAIHKCWHRWFVASSFIVTTLFSPIVSAENSVIGKVNKITWPPQAEMINGTVSVLVIVSVIATFLGVVDFGLSRMMQMVLG